MTVTEDRPALAEDRTALAVRVAAFMQAEGITGHYGPVETAARVAAQSNPEWLAMALEQGGTPYLRDMCSRVKDLADLADAEWTAEEIRHGHLGPRLEIAR